MLLHLTQKRNDAKWYFQASIAIEDSCSIKEVDCEGQPWWKDYEKIIVTWVEKPI